MKALLVAALVAVSGSLAHAATAADLEAQAQKAYEGRDYSQAGTASAQQASNLFGQAVALTTDASKKGELIVRQAASCFFVGDSSPDNNTKITQHWNGYVIAKAVYEGAPYGIKDVTQVADVDVQRLQKLAPDQLKLLAEALYVAGINLGQWGQANGIMESLNRWPELKASMELIVKIGAKTVHEYGAYRTLGRGLFKIPGILGGDVAKATKYLQAAVQGTLVPGLSCSTNGYNNLFYADVLKDAGKDAEGKKLLQDFISAAQANPEVLPGYAPETKEAKRLAQEMLKTW